MKWLGISSLVIAILAIPPSMVSGLGVLLALFGLILSGTSALLGNFKYVIIVLIITTVNLFCLSIASTLWDTPNDDVSHLVKDQNYTSIEYNNVNEFIKFISIPYGIIFLCIGIGIPRRKKRS